MPLECIQRLLTLGNVGCRDGDGSANSANLRGERFKSVEPAGEQSQPGALSGKFLGQFPADSA